MKNRNIRKVKPFLKTGRKYFSGDICSKHMPSFLPEGVSMRILLSLLCFIIRRRRSTLLYHIHLLISKTTQNLGFGPVPRPSALRSHLWQEKTLHSRGSASELHGFIPITLTNTTENPTLERVQTHSVLNFTHQRSDLPSQCTQTDRLLHSRVSSHLPAWLSGSAELTASPGLPAPETPPALSSTPLARKMKLLGRATQQT